MNELIAFGNGVTARMNTLEITDFLNDHRPAGQNKYEHNKIVKKAEKLMAQGVIKGRQKIDLYINQEDRGVQVVKGFEFTGEQGERDVIVVVGCFLPAVTGAMWDRWHELLERCRALEQEVLVLKKTEALAKEADVLMAQMQAGEIDTKDAMDRVAVWKRHKRSGGSEAGRRLNGQRKLNGKDKELTTIAIGYVQPQLPLN